MLLYMWLKQVPNFILLQMASDFCYVQSVFDFQVVHRKD